MVAWDPLTEVVKISQSALRRGGGKTQWWIEATSPSRRDECTPCAGLAAMEGEMAAPASGTKASTEQAAGSLYCLDGCGSPLESSASWVL